MKEKLQKMKKFIHENKIKKEILFVLRNNSSDKNTSTNKKKNYKLPETFVASSE